MYKPKSSMINAYVYCLESPLNDVLAIYAINFASTFFAPALRNATKYLHC